ncbi:hypothetical protein HELRODRAFT_158856 [Helobdella robusta]|uniref:Endonuclease/exonuclease/phosphatase domain-containing protein n=1 Tax=Helobdella robusta TaxID=6412 RepID=T1ENC4_HELRO|nr:hypothetical protein HELRODRAFT_158856 [Helobdella robusta]ESO12350.1 hypothetical protein HELRODRAFT_158856 [Helobdella robusta]
MDSVDIKNMIIKNVSKLKSLDVSLGRIGLSHDLSPEQKKELRSKIEEARALEASDKGFLYRVRDFGVRSLTLGAIDDDYLESSLDGNKCLMMKGTGNDLNDNVNFGCCNDGHGLDGGGYSMVCGTGSDLNVIGKNGCGKDDGSDCVITNGTGNDRNESGGFNDLKKVGNNNVMKGGAVGRNIGGIKNDRTNNNFCVVKIKLGLLNIRSIGLKYNIIYDLISDGLDIFVVTESWHGSSENPSITLSTPPGYRFVDFVRDHDLLHVSQEFILLAIYRPGSAQLSGLFFKELISILENITVLSSRIILTGDFNVHVEKTNDPYAANLNDIFDNFQLINRVKAPTHLRGGTLDLIVTSENFPVHDCLVHPKNDQANKSQRARTYNYLQCRALPGVHAASNFLKLYNVYRCHWTSTNKKLIASFVHDIVWSPCMCKFLCDSYMHMHAHVCDVACLWFEAVCRRIVSRVTVVDGDVALQGWHSCVAMPDYAVGGRKSD